MIAGTLRRYGRIGRQLYESTERTGTRGGKTDTEAIAREAGDDAKPLRFVESEPGATGVGRAGEGGCAVWRRGGRRRRSSGVRRR